MDARGLADARRAYDEGRWRDAEASCRRQVEDTAAAGGAPHADALFWLARCEWEIG